MVRRYAVAWELILNQIEAKEVSYKVVGDEIRISQDSYQSLLRCAAEAQECTPAFLDEMFRRNSLVTDRGEVILHIGVEVMPA